MLRDRDDVVEDRLMSGRNLAKRMDRPVAARDAFGSGRLRHRHDDRGRGAGQTRIGIDPGLDSRLDVSTGNILSHRGPFESFGRSRDLTRKRSEQHQVHSDRQRRSWMHARLDHSYATCIKSLS